MPWFVICFFIGVNLVGQFHFQYFLATVKSPTSVAFVSEENGNLSITLLLVTGVKPPPEVYPEAVEDCPAEALACVKSPISVALVSVANGNFSIVFTMGGGFGGGI
jgi:hypothetical protein